MARAARDFFKDFDVFAPEIRKFRLALSLAVYLSDSRGSSLSLCGEKSEAVLLTCGSLNGGSRLYPVTPHRPTTHHPTGDPLTYKSIGAGAPEHTQVRQGAAATAATRAGRVFMHPLYIPSRAHTLPHSSLSRSLDGARARARGASGRARLAGGFAEPSVDALLDRAVDGRGVAQHAARRHALRVGSCTDNDIQ